VTKENYQAELQPVKEIVSGAKSKEITQRVKDWVVQTARKESSEWLTKIWVCAELAKETYLDPAVCATIQLEVERLLFIAAHEKEFVFSPEPRPGNVPTRQAVDLDKNDFLTLEFRLPYGVSPYAILSPRLQTDQRSGILKPIVKRYGIRGVRYTAVYGDPAGRLVDLASSLLNPLPWWVRVRRFTGDATWGIGDHPSPMDDFVIASWVKNHMVARGGYAWLDAQKLILDDAKLRKETKFPAELSKNREKLDRVLDRISAEAGVVLRKYREKYEGNNNPILQLYAPGGSPSETRPEQPPLLRKMSVLFPGPKHSSPPQHSSNEALAKAA
jgi:hypothetical protein